jgi:hypothetical protein
LSVFALSLPPFLVFVSTWRGQKFDAKAKEIANQRIAIDAKFDTLAITLEADLA